MAKSSETKIILALSPAKVRAEIQEDLKWEREAQAQSEWRFMRAAYNLYAVQKNLWWRDWKSSETGKSFESFTEWINLECQIGKRSKVYELIDVAKYLNEIPRERLMELGKSKCYELARVAKHKPRSFKSVLNYLEKHETLPMSEVKQVCANALAGEHLESRAFVTMELRIPAAGAVHVRKALAVVQAMEPIQEPDTSVGMGVNLEKICREYLSGKVEAKVLAQLEEAGAFAATRFKLEG